MSMERKICLLRHKHMKSAAEAVKRKVKKVSAVVDSLTREKARLSHMISKNERGIKSCQEIIRTRTEKLEQEMEVILDANRSVLSVSPVIYDVRKDELSRHYEIELNQTLAAGLEPLAIDVLGIQHALDTFKSARIQQNKDRGENEDQNEDKDKDANADGGKNEDKNENPSQPGSGSEYMTESDFDELVSRHDVILDIVKRVYRVRQKYEVVRLEARVAAIRFIQPKTRSLVAQHKNSKQQLMEELNDFDAQFQRAELGNVDPKILRRTAATGGAILNHAIDGLKKIKGVMGLLHDLVKPKDGFESALWSVMGDDADLLIVEDAAAVKRCMTYMKRTPLTLAKEIINISSYERETFDEADHRRIRILCHEAYPLKRYVNVDEGPYQDLITELGTKNAMLMPDIYEFVDKYEGHVPAITYCDRQGLTRTPECMVRSFTNCVTHRLTADDFAFAYGPKTPKAHVPVELLPGEEELLYDNEEKELKSLPLSDVDALKINRVWISKQIRLLKQPLKHAEELINEKERLIGCFETELLDNMYEPTKPENEASLEHERDPFELHYWVRFIQMLVTRMATMYTDAVQGLKNSRQRMADLERFKKQEESTLEAALATRSQSFTKIMALCAGFPEAREKLETAKAQLDEHQKMHLELEEGKLKLVKEAHRLLSEDVYYVELAEKVLWELVQREYKEVHVRVKNREMLEVEKQCYHMRPKQLIKKLNAEIAKMPPALQTSTQGREEKMEMLVANYEAIKVRADEAQRVALARLDGATKNLNDAKESRSQRMAANLAELTRRAAKAYEIIVVGRWTLPRINRFFLVPLNDLEPWKGVMCSVHPPSKQTTPVVQLSNGELAITELCIKIAALLGEGTQVMLFDEVDASLDTRICNALGNFIRKQTGGPDGGQALIATHRRPMYNTAHALIGLYRIEEAEEDTDFSLSESEHANSEMGLDEASAVAEESKVNAEESKESREENAAGEEAASPVKEGTVAFIYSDMESEHSNEGDIAVDLSTSGDEIAIEEDIAVIMSTSKSESVDKTQSAGAGETGVVMIATSSDHEGVRNADVASAASASGYEGATDADDAMIASVSESAGEDADVAVAASTSDRQGAKEADIVMNVSTSERQETNDANVGMIMSTSEGSSTNEADIAMILSTSEGSSTNEAGVVMILSTSESEGLHEGDVAVILTTSESESTHEGDIAVVYSSSSPPSALSDNSSVYPNAAAGSADDQSIVNIEDQAYSPGAYPEHKSGGRRWRRRGPTFTVTCMRRSMVPQPANAEKVQDPGEGFFEPPAPRAIVSSI